MWWLIRLYWNSRQLIYCPINCIYQGYGSGTTWSVGKTCCHICLGWILVYECDYFEQAAVQQLFHPSHQNASVKDQISLIVQLITTTVHQIHTVFYSPEIPSDSELWGGGCFGGKKLYSRLTSIEIYTHTCISKYVIIWSKILIEVCQYCLFVCLTFYVPLKRSWGGA